MALGEIADVQAHCSQRVASLYIGYFPRATPSYDDASSSALDLTSATVSASSFTNGHFTLKRFSFLGFAFSEQKPAWPKVLSNSIIILTESYCEPYPK